ncbi:MAG: hypothetical protein KAT04_04900 [Methylococcales bacterium]|nr:hypothetical protein [Methylococcales bacterium]
MLKWLLLCLLLFNMSCYANESTIEVIPLHNRSSLELQSILTPMLEDSERIIANRSNLIIKATPARQQEIKELIEKLDTVLNNLSITVIQSRTKTAQQLNASAKLRVNIPIDHPAKSSTHIKGYFAQTAGLSKSDSTQVVKTLEGQTAYIRVGNIHPIQNTHYYDSPYGQHSISSNTQYIEATTGFRVIPRLTADADQVILDITPWSDKMTRNGQIETQGGHTTIRVNLGEWVEIGGFSENSQLSEKGSFSRTYSSSNKNMHILIKVEK